MDKAILAGLKPIDRKNPSPVEKMGMKMDKRVLQENLKALENYEGTESLAKTYDEAIKECEKYWDGLDVKIKERDALEAQRLKGLLDDDALVKLCALAVEVNILLDEKSYWEEECRKDTAVYKGTITYGGILNDDGKMEFVKDNHFKRLNQTHKEMMSIERGKKLEQLKYLELEDK